MQVYLIRHGIAVNAEEFAEGDDDARPLTARGIKRMRRNARALRKLGVSVSAVWTSPLLRACQTADLLMGEICDSQHPRICDALAPGGDFDAVVRDLVECEPDAAIALVGHEPYLGEFAAYVLTGSHGAFLGVRKGGVAAITFDSVEPPLRGTLDWLLTPGQLRRTL